MSGNNGSLTHTHMHRRTYTSTQTKGTDREHTCQLNQLQAFIEILQERWVVDGTLVPECNRPSSMKLFVITVDHTYDRAHTFTVNIVNTSRMNVEGLLYFY